MGERFHSDERIIFQPLLICKVFRVYEDKAAYIVRFLSFAYFIKNILVVANLSTLWNDSEEKDEQSNFILLSQVEAKYIQFLLVMA